MFEKATSTKLRFVGGNGQVLSVEDLWDLPLIGGRNNLDNIAKALNSSIKSADDESFVTKTSNPEKEKDVLRFDIVKHIISVKIAEKEAATNAAKTKQRREKLAEIIAMKEDESLHNLSLDELKALAKEV